MRGAPEYHETDCYDRADGDFIGPVGEEDVDGGDFVGDVESYRVSWGG